MGTCALSGPHYRPQSQPSISRTPRSSRKVTRNSTRPGRRRDSRVADLLPDLADGLLLELPNALARQVVLVADLFQRELVLVVEAEAPANDPRLDRRERAEQPAHFFRPARCSEV